MMRRLSSVRLMLALGIAAFVATPAALAADEDRVPDFLVATAEDETDEQAKARRAEAQKRWDAMTPEQREKIRKRFERFKKLPRDKQEALLKRLRRMGGSEGARAMGEHVKTMRSPEPWASTSRPCARSRPSTWSACAAAAP